MKKLMLLVASVGLLVAGLLPFASPASAAAGYNWLNAATIIGPDGTSYVLGDTSSGTHIYASTKLPSPTCTMNPAIKDTYKAQKGAAFIDENQNLTGSYYTLYTYTAPALVNGKIIGWCTETVKDPLTIGNSAASDIVYVRVDKNTIQAYPSGVGSGPGYNWDDKQTYTSTDGVTFTAGNKNCPSILTTTVDHRFVRVTRAGSDIGNDTKTVNGCTMQSSGHNFTLGSPQNWNLAPTGGSGGVNGGGDGGGSTEDTCGNDPSTGAFAWVICPAITSISKVMKTIYDDFIQPSLQVDPLSNDPGLKAVWVQFRNAADYLFVLVFLMVIFSTVTNVGVSSYTIKKALPRVVAAAILVQFSWFLCGFAIDVGNILGAGISSIVNTALGGANVVAGANTSNSLNVLMSNIATFGLLGVGAAVAVGAAIIAGPTLLFLLLGLLISLITLAVTLVVRLLVLKVLIVLAPIAMVLWVMPNTESLFKKWYQNFIKLVMMFPIIALLIAGGQIVQQAGMADKNNAFQELAAILAPMIAFFLIPTAFKMSGTMMGTVSGAIAKRGNALSSGARNSQFAKDKKAEYRGQSAQGYLAAQNKTGFGARVARSRGMLGSGNLIPTGASKRRVATIAAGFEKTQGDEFENQINNANDGLGFKRSEGEKGTPGYTPGEFTQLLSGQDVGTIKSTKASRKRAIQMAAKSQQWNQIRDAQASGKLDAGELAQGLAGTDVYTKAPDLLPGGSKGLQMSAGDTFSALHASTRVLALEHMQNQFGSADSNDNTKAQNTLASVLQAAENSPGSIDIDTQKTLYGYIAAPPPGMNSQNIAAIQARFDSTGTLKKKAQEVHVV